MTIEQFLLILRARYRIALFVLLLTIAGATAISLTTAPLYTATTTLVVEAKADPMAGIMGAMGGMTGYNIATQIDIINSARVSQSVVRMLKLDANPSIRHDWLESTKGKGQLDVWLAALLAKRLEVKPSSESNVITINYKSSDPVFAVAVANAFAQAYIDVNIELKVAPAKHYAAWFEQQSKVLRARVETAQATLSSYHQQHGIIDNGERIGSESSGLIGLESELMSAEAQAAEVRSKQNSHGGEMLGDVTQNSLILQLKSTIMMQEAKLNDVTGNIGHNHPLYQQMAAEIAALKKQLAIQTDHITESLETSKRVRSNLVGELKSAVETRKRRILDLNKTHDEMAVLQHDIESARKAYDAVSQSYAQSSLESQSTQTNVSILMAATDSIEPLSNTARNILASVLVGLLLGAGAALLRELTDRRIRSTTDLNDGVGVPVLAVLAAPKRVGESAWARIKRRWTPTWLSQRTGNSLSLRPDTEFSFSNGQS